MYKYWVMVITICLLASCHKQTDMTMSNTEKKQSAAGINVNLGLAYLNAGEMVRAKQKLLKAVEEAPESPQTLNAMAFYYSKIHEYEEAERYYQKAIRLQPQLGETHNNFGVFLCQIQKPNQAIEQFLLATRDNDYLDMAAAYENAGLCAMTIPDKSQARQFFEKTLRIDAFRANALIEMAGISIDNHEYLAAKNYLIRYYHSAPETGRSIEIAKRFFEKTGEKITPKTH